jgi:hypothetical protein
MPRQLAQYSVNLRAPLILSARDWQSEIGIAGISRA